MIIFNWINQYKKSTWITHSGSWYSIFSLGFNNLNRPYIIVLGLGLEIIVIKR